MKPIQTSRIIERMLIDLPPQYWDGWFFQIYPDRYYEEQIMSVNTEITRPYGVMPSNRAQWVQECNEVLLGYVISYLSEYEVAPVVYYKQASEGGYIYAELYTYIRFWDVVDIIKQNYYDVSVGDNEPGYTWKYAYINIAFFNTPEIIRAVIRRRLHDGKLYKNYSTYIPPDLISPEYLRGERFPVAIQADIDGEYKWYEGENLLRREVSTTYTNSFDVPLYPGQS